MTFVTSSIVEIFKQFMLYLEHSELRAHNLKLNNNEMLFTTVHFKFIYVATQYLL